MNAIDLLALAAMGAAAVAAVCAAGRRASMACLGMAMFVVAATGLGWLLAQTPWLARAGSWVLVLALLGGAVDAAYALMHRGRAQR